MEKNFEIQNRLLYECWTNCKTESLRPWSSGKSMKLHRPSLSFAQALSLVRVCSLFALLRVRAPVGSVHWGRNEGL
jgi:hypothetical protein